MHNGHVSAAAARQRRGPLEAVAADRARCRAPARQAVRCLRARYGKDRTSEAARWTAPSFARPAQRLRGGGASALVYPRRRGIVSDAVGALPPDANAGRADRLRAIRAMAPRASAD